MHSFHLDLIINKQTKRYLTILTFLSNSIYPVTLNSLAKITGVTTRTILSDINILKDLFPDDTWSLTGIKNNGFSLCFPNTESLLLLKKKLISEERLFIIITSIFNNNLLSITAWSELLFISEQTLLRNLTPLKKILKTYKLILTNSPVDIHGSEVNIRLFFFTYFYEARTIPHILEPTPEIIEFYTQSLEYWKSNTSNTSSPQFNKTTYWLMIGLQRIRNTQFISLKNPDILDLENTPAYLTIEKLSQEFCRTFKVAFPKDEVIFLYSWLKYTTHYFDCCISTNYPNQSELQYIILDYVNQLVTQFKLGNDETNKLSSYFQIYLKNLIELSKISPLFQKNSFELNEYAGQKYRFIFDICFKFLEKNLYTTFNYNYDIAVNLTLIVSTVIHQANCYNKSILFVFEGNENLIAYLRARISVFSHHEVKIHFINGHDITKEIIKKMNIDLIIANYEKLYIDIKIPIFKTSSIPTEHDWNHIQKLLSKKV